MGHRKMGIFMKICIGIFAVYAVLTLLTLQGQINERKAMLEETERQLTIAQQKNAQLKAVTESEWDEDALRQIARERLGLIEQGEELYIDLSN